jgi:DNA-binding transcriptional ArsR family regulator
MPAPVDRLDAIFSTLADPTRRVIMERLAAKGEMPVGDIARPFNISAPAISRHLGVLERAGLIERRVDRQRRLIRARPDALKPLEGWLARQYRHWSSAFDRLDAALAADTARKKKS